MAAELVLSNDLFAQEALGLRPGQTEADLDEEINSTAKKAGLLTKLDALTLNLADARNITPPLGSPPPSDTATSSTTSTGNSFHSKSTSTDLTRPSSRSSTDSFAYERWPSCEEVKKTSNVRHFTIAASFDNYDSWAREVHHWKRRRRPNAPMSPPLRSSTSQGWLSSAGSSISGGSTPSSPASVMSSTSSRFRSMFGRKSHQKTLSLEVATLANTEVPVQLPCGCYYTKELLKARVNDGLKCTYNLPATCCSKPIPASTLRKATTAYERDLLTQGLLYCFSVMGPTRPNTDSKTANVANSPDVALKKAMQNHAFAEMRRNDERVARRVVAFEAKQRRALRDNHELRRRERAQKHVQSRILMEVEHAKELETLETSQDTAELDVLDAQEKEQVDVATALRHMERYCHNRDIPAQGTPRHITADEWIALARQRATKHNLEKKHAKAIAVLRSKQEGSIEMLKRKQAKNEREVDEARRQGEEEDEQMMKDEEQRLDNVIDRRRRRVEKRWELQMEIWRKTLEAITGKPFLDLPTVGWPRPGSSGLGTMELIDDEEFISKLDGLASAGAKGKERADSGGFEVPF